MNPEHRTTETAIDPTENVKTMLREAVSRLDDLHNAEIRRVNEQMELRAEYSVQLGMAEAKRIDAIRSVDVAAVAVANERATAQAVVLANQVASSAETLRALVAATAVTVAQQLSQLSTQLSDRISALEKSSYEGQGSKGGSREMYGWVIGGLVTLVTIGIALYAVLNK